MFERFKDFLDRLKIHLQGEDTILPPLKEIIVKFLAQLLLTIGLKTKLMKEGRTCELIERHFLSIGAHLPIRPVLQSSRWQGQ